MQIRHVRKISFVASFLSMMRKLQYKKEILYWDILQQLRHVYGLAFAFFRSSEMSICSSSVALMDLWATDVTLAVLDNIGSICIKAVASKIMHSVFSIMLLCLQICF